MIANSDPSAGDFRRPTQRFGYAPSTKSGFFNVCLRFSALCKPRMIAQVGLGRRPRVGINARAGLALDTLASTLGLLVMGLSASGEAYGLTSARFQQQETKDTRVPRFALVECDRTVRSVVAVVHSINEIAVDSNAKTILNAAADYAVQECPIKPPARPMRHEVGQVGYYNISVSIYEGDASKLSILSRGIDARRSYRLADSLFSSALVSARNYNPQTPDWQEYRNGPAEQLKMRMAQEERERASRAAIELRQRAQDSIAAAKRTRAMSFTRRFGASTLVSASTLKANPFLHRGRIVAVVLHLISMQTASTAFFGEGGIMFTLTDVPTGQFTNSNDLWMVAIKVIDGSGGRIAFRFVGAEKCGVSNGFSPLLCEEKYDFEPKKESVGGAGVVTGPGSSETPRATRAGAEAAMATPTQASTPTEDRFAETPLGKASRTGVIATVRQLLASGVDVNQTFGYKLSETALMGAAKQGQLEVVKALIRAGAKVNAIDGNGNTAIGLAAAGGHLPTVQALISAGAALRGGGDSFPEPPLHMAARAGRLAVVRALLQAGADRNERFFGQTAANVAKEAGHGDVERLLAGGAI